MSAFTFRIGLVLALALVLGLLLIPGGAGEKVLPWKPVLSEDVYKELTGRSIKKIQAILDGKNSPEDAELKKVQAEAIILAGYTLSTKGHDKPAEVGLRMAALQVAKLGGAKGKLAELRKAAADLSGPPATTSNPSSKDLKENLHELTPLMDIFLPKAKGGDGIHTDLQVSIPLKGALNGMEEKIRKLAMKKLTDANVEKTSTELALFGYRVAVLGQITYEYAPAQKAKADPKEWRDLSLSMRDASVELAEAARKKDGEAILKASNRLNSSCSQCHSAFRIIK